MWCWRQCDFFRNLSEYGPGFPRMQWLEKVLHHPVYPEYNMALGFTVRNYQNSSVPGGTRSLSISKKAVNIAFRFCGLPQVLGALVSWAPKAGPECGPPTLWLSTWGFTHYVPEDASCLFEYNHGTGLWNL